MSAATAVLITMVSAHVTLGQILMICIPAGFCGVFLGALSVYRKGLDLEKDPEFQRRLAAGEIAPPRRREDRIITPQARLSVVLFALAVIAIVVLGSFPSLLPSWTVAGKVTRLSIPNALEMVMLCFGLVTALLFKIKPARIINNPIFTTGMMAVVAIFGIAWMTDTLFNTHSALLIATLGGFVKHYPYLFAGHGGAAVEPGSRDSRHRPAGHEPGCHSGTHGRNVPRCFRYQHYSRHWSGYWRGIVRPDRHYKDREVRSQSQLYPAGAGLGHYLSCSRLFAVDTRSVILRV
jgi:hypothetical protein